MACSCMVGSSKERISMGFITLTVIVVVLAVLSRYALQQGQELEKRKREKR